MVNLELEIDEGIVLQTSEVERYGIKELSLNEMVLTNKNIVCVYEKSTGLFSKPEIKVEKIPLSTIKVANGQAQVMIHDSDEYGKGLQVLFISGHREHFIFSDSPKKTMPIWINEINKILVGEPLMPVQPENTEVTYTASDNKPKKSLLGGLAGALGSLDIQSAMEKAQEKIGQFTSQIQGENSQSQPTELSYNETQIQQHEQPPAIPVQQEEVIAQTSATSPTSEPKMSFCSNCGTKLNEGSKFCHGCGAAIGVVQKESSPVPPPVVPTQQVEKQDGHYKERQQEYVGKVLKCPNCGAIISESTAICPDCGMHITGKSANTSVQAFKDELMSLDNTRVSGFKGMLLSNSTLVDPADKRKVTLIQNFPIPNSVDDIIEFMLLAIANIDVGLSRGKWDKRAPGTETSSTIKRTISNAWVAKMIQAYKKAEISFPDDPAFIKIQNLYMEKAIELKIIKK